MLKRAIYFFISTFLQISVIAIPIAKASDIGVIQPNKWESLQPAGKYGIESGVHYASSVKIEGSAGVNDVSSCMDIVNLVLDAVPEEHAEALENLSLIFDDGAKRGEGGGNIIRLRCSNMSEEELAAVFVHEIGHVVDTGLINSYEGTESGFLDGQKIVYTEDKSVDFYSISWNSDSEFTDGISTYSFVSGYAMTDPFEDFAESYAYYVLHGESFRRLALLNTALEAKYDFLRDYVFDGVEYDGIDEYKAPLFDRPYDVTRLPFYLGGL